MDRHMRDSLDQWLTTPPEEMYSGTMEEECTIDRPHGATECNGVHYDESDT